MRWPEADPEWTLVQQGFDPRTNRHFESIFATGSGYMTVRGSLEEGLRDDPQDREFNRSPDDVTLEQPQAGKSKWGTYVPGIAGPHPLLNEEIINLPWFLGISLSCAGEPLDLEHSDCRNHLRLLDLRDGVLHRRLTWVTAAGIELELAWHRFISMARPNLSVQELEIRVAKGRGRLRIAGGIDGNVRTSGFNHFLDCACSLTAAGHLACEVRTNGGNRIVIGSVFAPAVLDWRPEVGVHRASLWTDCDLAPGARFCLIKYSAVATDRDLAAGEPADRVAAVLQEAMAAGLPALHEEQAAAWAARWEAADVVIEGDLEAQRAIRFSLYHLLRARPAGDSRVSICPKGYTGDAYFGRFFWDTEIYLLPFYVYTDPAAARNLVLFRHHTLPGARRNAAVLNYAGAKYAWESGLDGTEQCPNWQYADLEVHVTADVVYGLCHYAAATGDREFLYRYGVEVMVETARYWVERVDPGQVPGQYNLLGVMGPDEYTLFSRNNAFTVHLVKFALSRTVALLKEMQAARPLEYAALAERLGLTPGEIGRFAAVGEGLAIPRQQDLILQAEDFPSLADLNLAESWPDRTRPLGHFISRERRYRSKCLKQADVLALVFLFPQDFTEAEMGIAYDYYEPLTSHDSSLSPTIHAAVAAWLGRRQEAMAFFRRSALVDLDPGREGAAEGIHMANAGGNWLAVIQGFAGVRNAIQSAVLMVSPHLPSAWSSLSFTLIWQGCPLRFRITQTEIAVRNLGNRVLPAILAGREVELIPDSENTVAYEPQGANPPVPAVPRAGQRRPPEE
ncbi:MAG: glycoside hydrolase family 65 protein [Bacteroidota bacterium]